MRYTSESDYYEEATFDVDTAVFDLPIRPPAEPAAEIVDRVRHPVTGQQRAQTQTYVLGTSRLVLDMRSCR